jgi:hypothetical protein
MLHLFVHAEVSFRPLHVTRLDKEKQKGANREGQRTKSRDKQF